MASLAKRRAKVLHKNKKVVKNYLKEGKYYEAEQLLKSLAIRLQSQEQYDDAIQLLYQGCIELQRGGKYNAAGDLAKDIFSIFNKAKTPADAERVEMLHQIFKGFEWEDSAAAASSQDIFMKLALKWTKEQGHNGYELTLPYAQALRERKQYHKASMQFLKTENMSAFCDMIFEWARLAPSQELPFFVTRAVLQLLVIKNDLNVAKSFFETCESRMSNTEEPITNFTRMFLEALGNRSQSLYQLLMDKYQPVLKMDSKYNQWCNLIGNRMLGIPKKQNLLSTLLNTLGGGGST